MTTKTQTVRRLLVFLSLLEHVLSPPFRNDFLVVQVRFSPQNAVEVIRFFHGIMIRLLYPDVTVNRPH